MNPYNTIIKVKIEPMKPYTYNWLNVLVWFVCLPVGALLWIASMTWILCLIF